MNAYSHEEKVADWKRLAEYTKKEGYGKPISLKSYLRRNRQWRQATLSSRGRLKLLALKRAEKLNSVPHNENHGREFRQLVDCCIIIANLEGIRGSEASKTALDLASHFSKEVQKPQKELF